MAGNEFFESLHHGLQLRQNFFGWMLVAITSEAGDVAEEHADVLEATGLDAVGGLQLFGDILRQNDVEQFLGAMFFLLDLAQVGYLAVAQAFFLQARADARTEEDRVEGLGHVIFGAQFDAADDAFKLVEGRNHDDGNVAQSGIVFHASENFAAIEAGHEKVQQHQVELAGADEFEGFETIGTGGYLVAEFFQAAAQ